MMLTVAISVRCVAMRGRIENALACCGIEMPHATDTSGTLPNGIDRNQSLRTSRLCADYFTSIKMRSSKRLMANSSFIDKLSYRRLEGGTKIRKNFANAWSNSQRPAHEHSADPGDHLANRNGFSDDARRRLFAPPNRGQFRAADQRKPAFLSTLRCRWIRKRKECCVGS